MSCASHKCVVMILMNTYGRPQHLNITIIIVIIIHILINVIMFSIIIFIIPLTFIAQLTHIFAPTLESGFDEPQPEILYDFDELIWSSSR